MYNSKLHWPLSLVITVTVCIFICAFASLVNISKGILSSKIGLNICAIIPSINNYKSIINKKKKKHIEIAFLAKTNLDCIKGLISRSLTDSYVEHNYFHLTDVLRRYDYLEEEITKLET